MFLLLVLLSDDGMDDCLEDILFGDDAVHILDKLVGLVHFVVFQIVDDKVKSCLGNNVYKRWQNLQRVFSATENHKVVPEQVVVLEDVTHGRTILQGLEFGFGCLSVIELVVVARSQVHTDDRISMKTEINGEDFQTDIVVIHLVVAEGNVDVDGVEVLVLHEQLLVDFSGLLEMTAQVVQRGHAQLVFNA